MYPLFLPSQYDLSVLVSNCVPNFVFSIVFLGSVVGLGACSLFTLDLVGGASLTLQADFSGYIQDLNKDLAENLKENLHIENISSNSNKIEFALDEEALKKLKEEKSIEKIVNSRGFYQINYEKNRY